ncbi:hypothetical protein FSP39_007453 [Pinctada imbricata]|uniref:Uncharacterized protein n=1 Tax=Pinctada imbricata TaxID=66713 RepID=A0AA88XYL7_PINIB|nr:hypothetical protein FSP39_007453 [Pinctada imbricata]
MAYNATTISPNTDPVDSDCTWIKQHFIVGHGLFYLGRTVLYSHNAEEDDSGSEMVSSKRNRLYVRTLLFNEGNSKNGNSTERLDVKEQLLKNIADQRACFQKEISQRASNRIASIFVISAILLYQWIVVCFRISAWVHEHLKQLKIDDGWLWIIIDERKRLIHAAIASFYVASFAAGIILIANMVKIYSSHRRHINRLLAGNNTFIPIKCWNTEPSVLLARNMMYPGIQIGHIVSGNRNLIQKTRHNLF